MLALIKKGNMKKIKSYLLIIIFSIPFIGSAQKKSVERYVLSGNQISLDPDSDWSFHLQNYSDSIGTEISRSSILNGQANSRAIYYASILDYNSLDRKLNESMRNIPEGPESHTRAFGNPGYFSEPENLKYVHPYTTLEKGGIRREVKSEIMQECFYSIKSDSPMNNDNLIIRAIKAHKNKKGESFMLSKYLSSSSHKKSIENKDNEKFGTSSVYIIHKWYDNDSSKWVNEVMILNVTVFS
jgi:hypothetical protein